MKDELSEQMMKEFVGLKAKTQSYLKDNNNKDKKAKDTKKCVIKIKLKCQDYKNCFEATQIEKNIKEHTPNWTKIPVNPHRIFIVGGSESLNTNALLNLVNHESDIDKIYLYAKGPYEPKYQLLINKR